MHVSPRRAARATASSCQPTKTLRRIKTIRKNVPGKKRWKKKGERKRMRKYVRVPSIGGCCPPIYKHCRPLHPQGTSPLWYSRFVTISTNSINEGEKKHDVVYKWECPHFSISLFITKRLQATIKMENRSSHSGAAFQCWIVYPRGGRVGGRDAGLNWCSEDVDPLTISTFK